MTNEKKSLSTSLIYFFGALGGLLFGYDTGVISGAILFIEKQLFCWELSSEQLLLDLHQISTVVVSC